MASKNKQQQQSVKSPKQPYTGEYVGVGGAAAASLPANTSSGANLANEGEFLEDEPSFVKSEIADSPMYLAPSNHHTTEPQFLHGYFVA